MRKLFLMFLAAAVALVGSYTTADAGSVTTKFDDVDITIGGQMRPRFEYSDRTLTDAGMANHYFTQRTRVNVGINSGGVKGFFQLQDVRAWGEETSTLGDYDADHLDIHQAYIDLIDVAGRPFDLRIGRQELILDGHRLMGNVGWTQQARSWDGIKLTTNLGPALVHVWGFKEREGTCEGNCSTAATSGAETVYSRDKNVIGAYAKVKPTDVSTLSAILVYQNDDGGGDAAVAAVPDDPDTVQNEATSAVAEVPGSNLNQVTMGLRGTHKYMGFTGRLEGYYQTGDASSTKDIDAYMMGVRVGYKFKEVQGKPSITLWYDYVSGDDDLSDNDDESFDTLYATNHKFYGFMDYFPFTATQLGLEDFAVKASISPAAKTLLKVDFHHFTTAEPGASGNVTLGQELDVTLKYKYHKHLMVVAGYSHFFNDEMSIIKRSNQSDADWSYLMLDFKF